MKINYHSFILLFKRKIKLADNLFLFKMFFRAGFVGMRGKKENYEGNKRAGFVGMRGKKGDWPDFIERDFDHLKMRLAYFEFIVLLH